MWEGQALPEKKCGSLDPRGHPGSATMSLRITPSFAGCSFRVILGGTWYYLPIHHCSFWFMFNLNIFSCRYACITLE